MMNISIAKDFSDVPAGRYLADGDFTGQEFREKYLVPALKNADNNHPVIVDINDVEGYGSSFLEEAFGGLVREEQFSKEELNHKLKIEANSTYNIYKDIIKLHIEEA
jgi:hypothetical protein